MAEHMKTTLVNDALITAIWKRKPKKADSGILTEAANMLLTATIVRVFYTP
jgi:hypothetical protein